MERGAWWATVCGVAKEGHDWRLNNNKENVDKIKR